MTEEGIDTCTNDVQSIKAFLGISIINEGIKMFFNLVQFAKHLASILISFCDNNKFNIS